MNVRVLSFHAPYVCRESGACCTSNWPIAIEADRLDRARQAIAAGRLRAAADACFEAERDEGGGAVLARAGGRCVFYSARDRARCDLHHALGHEALPLACRQFPRVSLLHPAGVSVTLSHYCPTAAALLDAPGPFGVVTSSTAFPASGEYVGLNAREALPPLLRPDMVMDWDAWTLWETLALDVLAEADSPHAALRRLHDIVEAARVWSPADGSLLPHLERVFTQRAHIRSPADWPDCESPGASAMRDARVAEVLASIPAGIRPDDPPTAPPSATSSLAARRFLASHAFASWTACLGLGVRTWLRSLQAAQALLDSGLTVRDADLWLRHLADPTALAETWSEAETD